MLFVYGMYLWCQFKLLGCELFEPRSLVEKHETLTLKKKSRSVGGALR